MLNSLAIVHCVCINIKLVSSVFVSVSLNVEGLNVL